MYKAVKPASIEYIVHNMSVSENTGSVVAQLLLVRLQSVQERIERSKEAQKNLFILIINVISKPGKNHQKKRDN